MRFNIRVIQAKTGQTVARIVREIRYERVVRGGSYSQALHRILGMVV